MSDDGSDQGDLSGEPVKTVDSLPDRPLTEAEYRVLETSDALEGVSPTVAHSNSKQLHGVTFEREDVLYYVVWCPEDEQWIRVVSVDRNSEGDKPWDIEAVQCFDDETGESTVSFDPSPDTLVHDIYDHIRVYMEHMHDNPDQLWFITDTARELHPELRHDP